MRKIEQRAKELGLNYTLDPIQPGDLYLAERNTGPKLLTCIKVNKEGGWIVPTGLDYCYDIPECVKIIA